MRLLWVIPGYYGLFRVIMGYSGLLWGFVAPFWYPVQKYHMKPIKNDMYLFYVPFGI